MANEVSILRNKTQLTVYQHGVTFTLKTPGQDYSIDRDTANKLADLLIAPGDTKFVKVRTAQGQVVLNLSSIMAVAVDERPVQGALRYIRDKATELMDERGLPVEKVLEDDPDKIKWFHRYYFHWAKSRELPVLSEDDFASYFRQAATNPTILDNIPLFTDKRTWFA